MLLQDVRYALRAFRFRPGFAAVAILTLAVGIGANTAVFSVVHGVLLKPLPYHDPDRLVQIWEVNPARNWTHETVAPANFLDWKARSRSFADMAYYIGSDTRLPGLADVTLTGGGDPERLRAMTVSSNFFAVLGTAPALGRTFHADEDLPGRSRVAILSDAFWRRRFGCRPRHRRANGRSERRSHSGCWHHAEDVPRSRSTGRRLGAARTEWATVSADAAAALAARDRAPGAGRDVDRGAGRHVADCLGPRARISRDERANECRSRAAARVVRRRHAKSAPGSHGCRRPRPPRRVYQRRQLAAGAWHRSPSGGCHSYRARRRTHAAGPADPDRGPRSRRMRRARWNSPGVRCADGARADWTGNRAPSGPDCHRRGRARGGCCDNLHHHAGVRRGARLAGRAHQPE